jgi:hypothetical protein
LHCTGAATRAMQAWSIKGPEQEQQHQGASSSLL